VALLQIIQGMAGRGRRNQRRGNQDLNNERNSESSEDEDGARAIIPFEQLINAMDVESDNDPSY
jgi:hypothetical protein